MAIDRFLWGLLWAVAAGIPFALLGALFGASVRFAANWFDHGSESTVARALRNGAWAGGLFVGIVGFAVGGLLGLGEGEAGAVLLKLAIAVLALALLMIGAGLLGGLAFYLQRLGSEWSIAGIGLFVSGLFLGLPVRAWILRNPIFEDQDISDLTHLIVWCIATSVGVVALLVVAAMLWAIQRAFTLTLRLLTGGTAHRDRNE